MRVKLQQIIDAMEPLAMFAQKEMPARAAYRISKLVKKMHTEFREFQDARAKAIQKYGHKVKRKVGNEEREVTEVAPQNVEAFTAELRALLDTEVVLEGVAKIAFADIEALQLSPAMLADLAFIIEEPVELKQAA